MKPLEGYKMLDVSRYLPGPYCSMILADLGMKVLRIEEPKMGDPARWVGPKRNKDSVYYLAANRNKRSMGLNLKSKEGKEIFLSLCTRHDVVLENFKPGTMDRLGLGYRMLSEKNPALVFCSISGFGQEGPYRGRPGHDINYISLAGLLGIMESESNRPIIPAIPIADLTSGLLASIGILAALIARNKTGKGRYVDISMMDGIISSLCYQLARFGLEGKPPNKSDLEFGGDMPCYRVYRTADNKFMALGATDAIYWKKFCQLIGLPEIEGKQWGSGEERNEIVSLLETTFRKKTQNEWNELFAGKNVCCDPVRTIAELPSDPQVRNRRMIFEMNHSTEGKILQTGNPIKLSEMEEVFQPPPQLGENTEEVIREMGYDNETIALFRKKGVI